MFQLCQQYTSGKPLQRPVVVFDYDGVLGHCDGPVRPTHTDFLIEMMETLKEKPQRRVYLMTDHGYTCNDYGKDRDAYSLEKTARQSRHQGRPTVAAASLLSRVGCLRKALRPMIELDNAGILTFFLSIVVVYLS